MDVLNFSIDPPVLSPWISDEDKERNIILFDLQFDSTDDKDLRIDLDIAFNSIPVRRKNVVRKDFYVGCTGAEIQVSLTKGVMIKEYTKASTLNVNYSNESVYNRNTDLKLQPHISKSNNGTADFGLGSIQHSKSKKVTFSASFSCEERILAPVKIDNTIKWQIHMPKGEMVIRDYLIGNLYLSVTGQFNNVIKAGKVKVRPSDIIFFGPKRSPLSFRQSILMRFAMHKKNIKILNANGLETTFKEVNNE